MKNDLLHRVEDDQSGWVVGFWYGAWILLVVVVFAYSVFLAKTYLENQQLSAVSLKVMGLTASQQTDYENEIVAYKKKMDDFSVIVAHRKISLPVFNFIEQKTLPNVWFSNFNVSDIENNITLVGQAQTMEVLSYQVNAFEADKDNVVSVDVLNAETSDNQKVNFTMSLVLSPKVFSYSPLSLVTNPVP